MMRVQEEVVALRYVAVAVVGVAEGASVYAFVFHLKTASGAVYKLAVRYSALRRVARQLRYEQPEACASLPGFPAKYSMSRQTPQFLLVRGRALEAYLSAALGNPQLNTAPAVRELLRTAELHEPSARAGDAAAPPSTSSGELPRVLGAEPRSTATHAHASRSSGGVIALACGIAFHPMASVALAFALGRAFDQLLLCVACCVLGLAAGKLVRNAAATAPPNRVPGHNGESARNGIGPEGMHPATTIGTAVPAAATVPATAAPVGAAARFASPEDARACREAALALDELAGAIRAYRDPATAAASGWRQLQVKDAVDIHLNARPDGPTWAMGVGCIRATPDAILRASESAEFAHVLDKQQLKIDVLRMLPHQSCPLPDGWVAIRLQLQQSLYKSPAWPVGPRETCTVKLIARRARDGALRILQRSVELEGVTPPPGYVRATLGCGGFECTPQADGQTHVTYVNILNPNGNIPKTVVNYLVPDRALIIARLRRCITSV